MSSPRHYERYPERKPDTQAGAYTWLCRGCMRTLLLSHKYRWLGQGRQRRRLCVECFAKREAK